MDAHLEPHPIPPAPTSPPLRTSDSIGLLLILLGAILIAGVAFTSPLYIGLSGHVMGTITTSPNDHPTITYTVDGVNRSMSSGLHGTGWTLGQQIEISYNPSNPAQASTNGERLATVIFMSVGLPVAVAGLVLLIHAVVRFFIWRAVIAHGHREQATLTDVRQRLVNVITTYSTTFSCTWKSPDKVVHSFRSAPIRLDRRISLTDLPFTTLPVYVDLDHPTRYYVDDTEVRQYFASHR